MEHSNIVERAYSPSVAACNLCLFLSQSLFVALSLGSDRTFLNKYRPYYEQIPSQIGQLVHELIGRIKIPLLNLSVDRPMLYLYPASRHSPGPRPCGVQSGIEILTWSTRATVKLITLLGFFTLKPWEMVPIWSVTRTQTM